MSTQIPRPSSNTTNSSNSTNSNQPFTGNMDAYTLSMYEHTKRLMAAAQIPYGSPASLLLATSPNDPVTTGTGSGSFTDKLLVALWPVLVPTKVVDETANSLRSFLETLLRRSSASYNTLLAAFYYLVLFQSIATLPLDATKHTPCLQKLRSLQCPRRMFLAALMLGWKFTQEQAFSTATWATFSGLSVRELNRNEAAFLSMIDWRLYISQAVFAQWDTEVSYHVQTPNVALSGKIFGIGSSIATA
ncbi:G1/S-specific cyclin pas1 [Colletotrichum spaethianum]|uniref:G1/S-specific cyclin pas1 n=1 Tax=Colletotrichum spaethianum TaxID=700344 RepID=A0AA37UT32_9PEZI|nr:G1/S-specific cyclin pas1 [Colletotrichum spaethianum]GKT51108.1 G1/S-specific cyclin pas1 [Colletotrichum spaethianum]